MVYSQAAGLNFDVDGRLLRSFITRPMKLLKPKNPTVHSPADLNKVEFAVFAYLSNAYKTPDKKYLDLASNQKRLRALARFPYVS